MATREGLSGDLYRDREVFRSELDRVFARSWYCIGRVDPVALPGAYLAADVVGEPVKILRDHYGTLGAFHNVPVRVDEWQGCLFVNLSGDAPTLCEWLDDQDDQPLTFERWNLHDLRVGHTTTRVIRANWKILVENYEECLHCPTVHPELVDLIPTYRKGAVVDPERPDWGVALKPGCAALTATGTTALPVLPGLSADESVSVYGAYVFPNATIGVSGQVATLSTIHPRSVDTCVLVVQYLFAPDTIAADDFDPSDVVDFSELVSAQDAAVCERVQRGVASRAFTHGVYPAMDEGLHWFAQRYRSFLG